MTAPATHPAVTGPEQVEANRQAEHEQQQMSAT
jgi:hypothetical protein